MNAFCSSRSLRGVAMVGFLDVELSQKRMLVFFMLAVFIFVYPLILADHFYLDDNWRSQTAEMAWKEQGRLLVEWLYQGLSFTRGAPNLFPLPLLIACVAISFALRALTNHYFKNPTMVSCLVVLPLWYSPLFLQSLSYQYDGPATALGVAAIIYSIAFQHPSMMVRTAVSALCIVIGLSFYQMVINIYIGLCCLEWLRMANGGLLSSLAGLKDRLLQLLLGVMCYWLSTYQFITNERTALRELSRGWWVRLMSDLQLAVQKVALLYTDDNAWLCWVVFILACAGVGQVMYRILQMPASRVHKIVLGGLCLFALVLAGLSIPGLALVFDFYNHGARAMMGLSSALVLIFYLNHQVLTAVHSRLGGVLIIPLIAMLSFSYAYGRVMLLQKQLSTSIAQSIAYDVMSDNALRGVEHYHMVIESTHGWLVGADGMFKLMPALKYVLGSDFLVLPEMFPRSTGLTNVTSFKSKNPHAFLQDLYAKTHPVVNNKFYSIYVDGADAYILTKSQSADDVYFYHVP